MTEKLVVLAVTRMLSGMCTGGISLATGKWVRPVKEFGTVLLGDLTCKDRTVIRPLDIVEFALTKPRPRPPHIEDWVCDFVHDRPVRVGSVDDRPAFLSGHSEPAAPAQLLQALRSLALYEPREIEAVFRFDGYSGKYDARLRLPDTGARPIPVTDIKWRAAGRSLLDGREELVLGTGALKTALGVERVFVALGLSRLHEGRHWPLAVGVHTCPDYSAEVDYNDM